MAISFGNVLSACRSLKLSLRFAGGAARSARSLRGRRGLGFLRFAAVEIRAALGQHVGVAAGIFGPAAVAFGREHQVHDAIQEVAVVADEDDGAGIGAEHFLQHVQRFQIEVVGGLVQHQQVGGLGERARQHQAAALAAGQRAERRARLLRREQEILHVADDMLGLSADRDGIAAAAGQGFAERPVGIETFAALVERGHGEVGAEPHRAAVGRERAGEKADQRGLAAAVGADDADAVAAHHAQGEVLDDRPRVEGFADALGLDDQRAGRLGVGGDDLRLAGGPAIVAPRLPQRLQSGDAAHVALAARRHAVAHPVFLARDFAVELVLGDLFLFQLLVAPGLERAEAEVDAAGLAAVEPDGDAREVFQKAPVVGDQHQRRALLHEARFEPFDGRKVQVVGGLVEQQDVGVGGKHMGERGAAGFAARKLRGIFVAGQAELFQEIASLMRIVGGAEPAFDIGQRGGKAGEVGLLRQVADGGAGLHEALAAVGLDQARNDLEQRRLARAVAAHETDPLARGDGQLHALQQRRAAEGERDVGELDERRRHQGSGRRRRADRRMALVGMRGSPAFAVGGHCAGWRMKLRTQIGVRR